MARKKNVEVTESNKERLSTALVNIQEKLNSKYGLKVGLMEDFDMDIRYLSTGSMVLNSLLGGGVAVGRIIEFYGTASSGKTSMALSTIAEAQKNGLTCAFIDVEHAFAKNYARRIGVDTDKLIYSKPYVAEEVFSLAVDLASSDEVDLIVIDSVSAMAATAYSDDDKEITKEQMGIIAQSMSKGLKKLTPACEEHDCACIFINQVREKTGVMFGCLHGNNKIHLTDGRTMSMRELVKNKVKGSVWSLNEKTGCIEEKEIIDWHDNGVVNDASDWVQIFTTCYSGKRNRMGGRFTKNHLILSSGKWVEAGNIKVGDKVTSYKDSYFNGTVKQFISGMSCGDLTVSITDGDKGYIKIQDNNNVEYARWKVDKLSKYYKFKEIDSKGKHIFTSSLRPEFFDIYNSINKNGTKRNHDLLLENYSDMGLALYYMDDGSLLDKGNDTYRVSISIKRVKDKGYLLNLTQKLNEVSGLNFKCGEGSIYLNVDDTPLFFEKIKKYIPNSMQYKLPATYQGFYEDFELNAKQEVFPVEDTVVDVIISDTKNENAKVNRDKHKYDITVKDNHNYIVGSKEFGFVVHNSPETTTGGRALEFYASQRVRINRTKIIKGADDEAIGTEVKMEIKKNKTAAPFGVGETVLSFDSGIDKVGEIYVLGVKYKLIKKVGQRFYVSIPVNELTREEQTMLSNYPIEDNFIKIATYEQKTKDAIAEDENLFNVLSNRVVEILMAKQNELAVKNKNDVVELEGEED